MTAKLNRRIKTIDFIVAVEANVFFGWHLFVVEERIRGQVEPKLFVQLVFSSFDENVFAEITHSALGAGLGPTHNQFEEYQSALFWFH